ncbi:glycosyltransferase, exosortase A system-associated [Sphingomonas lacunae]|uniref:Glycosyltransferase, exosortase A system-associated n=1 Tax=Sphingomonas lacunae TaxID=2698828 RepID=A0A6M4AZD9_9SPHN|nr:TIGR04063 family PEP-CTERM/XrtA system glycosyltransferase [Sphingomonas lacunae]QJQ32401.1 glycosyltransferase, exosortase A system-associated [Sphingomonas lacunae]
MTRVLHILDHSLPAQSGYTFRTRAIMKAQQAMGWEVAGVTSLRHPLPGPDEHVVDGLTFFRTPGVANGRSPWRELGEVRALAERIGELAESWKPDILHAHSPVLTALAADRVAKRLSIPLLYEIRAFWEDAAVGNGTGTEGSLKYRLTRMLETRAVRRADAVAVICEGLRADLVRRGIDPAKIMVSPNGVDLELFGTPPARDGALAGDLGLDEADVIGFIGSFYDYEGLDDLIEAMPRLVALSPKVHLLLVGGGPMEAQWRAMAHASPVAERIHFVGRVPHQEVERYYSLIDILAYPRKAMRLTELVTPLKPLEAMAQRRLVAASDIGGHRELIQHGVTGTLFPPDDPAGLAKSLADLLADRAGWEERRTVARRYVEEQRNWFSNIRHYEPVYQRLLSGSGYDAYRVQDRQRTSQVKTA